MYSSNVVAPLGMYSSGSRRRSSGSRRGYTRTAGLYGRFGTKSRRSSRAPELKYWDVPYADYQFDATAEVPVINAGNNSGQLCLIPADTSASGRIGRRIVLKSIQWKMAVNMPATAIRDEVHWYIVQDTQCNGAAATYADVFEGAVAGLGLRNMANSARFRILHHWSGTLQSGAGVTGAFTGDTKYCTGYLKLNIPIEYGEGPGGGLSDQKSNNVFILAGDTLLQDDVTTMTGAFRLRYSDF